MLPVSGVVYLTNNCYLRCSHCFLAESGKIEEKLEIPFEKVIEMLEDFKKNKVFMVAYTGGDPLLHPRVFEILRETYKRNMMPLLGISGVGVTDEIAKKIYNSGVRCVQVSLDGSNEKINSAFRGSGVFDKVCESIIILQKNGIKTNLAVCLNNKNYEDYKSIIKFAYDRNIYKMKIAFWNDLNGCKVFQCLNKEQKKEVINYCKQFESEKNLDEWILCLEEAKELVKLHNKALVVEADGSIRSSEHGDVIGSIYSNMPSFYYGD